jgi:hypothetical protein
MMLSAWVAAAAMIVTPAAAQEDRTDLGKLEQDIAAAATATSVLQAWCDARHGAGAVKVTAVVDGGAEVPATRAQRNRLKVSAREPIGYRRVALMCGEIVLSRAENWYVPARLADEMRIALAGDAPFGAVIQPLAPTRQTLGSDVGWDGQGPSDALRYRALVRSAAGVPLAEVIETYQRVMLAP